jgi:hypothetical protein
MDMAETLGMFVCTPKYFDHVMGLAKAGRRAGVEVTIFFSGEGVALSQHPDFAELTTLAKVSLCEVSYHRLGYEGLAPGLDKKGHSSQLDHALMVGQADRYLVF